MIPHSIDYQEVLDNLQVNAETGLSSDEASRRLASYGENKLQERKKKAVYSALQNKFKDVMIIILLIAAGISFWFPGMRGRGFLNHC